MGFSVSGSFALLAVAFFVAFGMFHGASSNAVEGVTDAQRDAFDDRLDQQNTAIEITQATWDDANTRLTVEVNNTGSTSLSVNDTDLLVQGDYTESNEIADEFVLDGGTERRDTDVWAPGETYHVEVEGADIDAPTPPDRVKIVTETGIADTQEVV